MTLICIWQIFLVSMSKMSIDDFSKLVLALVALIALFLGPLMQWRIVKKQVQMQDLLAKLQIETQTKIATRQIADNISSKRQNWIDELRKDSSEFLTVVGRIQELKRPRVMHLLHESNRDDYKERLTFEMRAKELGIRIKLRLNAIEPEHNRLVQLLGEMTSKGYQLNTNYSTTEEEQVAKAFNEASTLVIEHLQAILKHEWERVKAGYI